MSDEENIPNNKNDLSSSFSVIQDPSIKINDKDKEKLDKLTKEDLEAEQFSNELNNFLQEKLQLTDTTSDIRKLSTGIKLLDTISGGGFGVGTFTMIVGNPGTFKSALLAQVIGHNQKEYGKLVSLYYDSENAMTEERLYNMGVRKPPIKPYTDVTVEKIFQTIEATCQFKESNLKDLKDIPAIIAWDSLANTSTEKERTTDDLNQTVGLKARLLSGLFPRYVSKMRENNISLIAINQLRTKLNMGLYAPAADLANMGDKEIPGGQAVKYNAFHLLYLKHKGNLKEEQYGFSGIKLEASFIKNKFFRPLVPVTLLVDFNTGISDFWTNYNFLVENKLLKSGAWNSLVSFPEKKFRTKDALEVYNTEPEFKKHFDESVESAIKSQIIDKYKV